MINIILNFISPLIQAIMLSYYIIIISQIFNNKKYNKLQILFSALILSISPFVSVIFSNLNPAVRFIVFSIPPFLVLKFLLRNDVLKSFLITIGTFMTFVITELISGILVSSIFKCDVTGIINKPYLLILLLIIQMILLLVLIKLIILLTIKSNNYIEIIENINSNQVFNLILICVICILPKILIRLLNKYEYSTSFLIISLIETIVMVVLTFIFFKRTLERDKAQSELFISELHNKTMIGMVDGVKTLKHDYNNIMQALSGYVATKQYDKLEEHINKVLQECNVVNNFSIITPELFNEPAIYGIMGAKYFLAVDKEINVDLDVTCDFTKISFSMPELSRILGILLDNAMEATQKCKNKYIRFEARYDKRKNSDIIKIINTYDTSITIDLDKIYEKGVSSKKVKSGIGLWEVKKLIKKNKNSQIYPTIENGKFAQNLIIERLTDFNEDNENVKSSSNNKEIMLVPVKSQK